MNWTTSIFHEIFSQAAFPANGIFSSKVNGSRAGRYMGVRKMQSVRVRAVKAISARYFLDAEP